MEILFRFIFAQKILINSANEKSVKQNISLATEILL